jgi:hypothetical protein
MVIAADYPFLDIFWTMLIFFFWVIWLFMLFTILADIFRRRDLSGWGKTGWIIFIIVLPYLGALVYLIAQHDGMAERSAEQAHQQRAQVDDYVRSVAAESGPAAEIDKAKQLLDSGAINQAEYEALKAKALAA